MANSTVLNSNTPNITAPKEAISKTPVRVIGGTLNKTEDKKEAELPLGYNEPSIFSRLQAKLKEEAAPENQDFFAKTKKELFNNTKTIEAKTTNRFSGEGSVNFHSVDIQTQVTEIVEQAWEQTSEAAPTLQNFDVVSEANQVVTDTLNNTLGAAVDTAKESFFDVADLFGKDILGIKNEQPKEEDPLQAAVEAGQITANEKAGMEQTKHDREWYQQLQSEANQSDAQEQQAAAAEMQRVVGQVMSKEEIQAYLGINSVDIKKPYYMQKVKEVQVQQQQAQEQQEASAGVSGEPDYFMQANMAGERSGGNHVMNAAG